MAVDSGDSVVRAWLSAMNKAQRIKPGGRLVFINKRTGTAVPMNQPQAITQNIPTGAAGQQPIRTDPIAELRGKGMILGRSKKARGRRG